MTLWVIQVYVEQQYAKPVCTHVPFVCSFLSYPKSKDMRAQCFCLYQCLRCQSDGMLPYFAIICFACVRTRHVRRPRYPAHDFSSKCPDSLSSVYTAAPEMTKNTLAITVIGIVCLGLQYFVISWLSWTIINYHQFLWLNPHENHWTDHFHCGWKKLCTIG